MKIKLVLFLFIIFGLLGSVNAGEWDDVGGKLNENTTRMYDFMFFVASTCNENDRTTYFLNDVSLLELTIKFNVSGYGYSFDPRRQPMRLELMTEVDNFTKIGAFIFDSGLIEFWLSSEKDFDASTLLQQEALFSNTITKMVTIVEDHLDSKCPSFEFQDKLTSSSRIQHVSLPNIKTWTVGNFNTPSTSFFEEENTVLVVTTNESFYSIISGYGLISNDTLFKKIEFPFIHDSDKNNNGLTFQKNHKIDVLELNRKPSKNIIILNARSGQIAPYFQQPIMLLKRGIQCFDKQFIVMDGEIRNLNKEINDNISLFYDNNTKIDLVDHSAKINRFLKDYSNYLDEKSLCDSIADEIRTIVETKTIEFAMEQSYVGYNITRVTIRPVDLKESYSSNNFTKNIFEQLDKLLTYLNTPSSFDMLLQSFRTNIDRYQQAYAQYVSRTEIKKSEERFDISQEKTNQQIKNTIAIFLVTFYLSLASLFYRTKLENANELFKTIVTALVAVIIGTYFIFHNTVTSVVSVVLLFLVVHFSISGINLRGLIPKGKKYPKNLNKSETTELPTTEATGVLGSPRTK